MEQKVILSTLPKTWIFDLGGTILKHNGYKLDHSFEIAWKMRKVILLL